MANSAEDLNQIAIIGMAGRFPGAGNVDAFWENLASGREGISTADDDTLISAGVPSALLDQPNYVRAKGVLRDADLFDAGFFGFSPREAEIMDPQHRVFLECAWEALESAGCDPRTFTGRVGVFAGASLNSYLLFNVMANQRVVDSTGSYQVLIANDKDFLTTRASYKLGLTGPSITVQTACSTSLTAVHLACQSLLNRECDIALAGGVSVSVPLTNGYLYEPGGILSADGHCRTFDAAAGGTVAGNGVGIVVLRRLADATTGGDIIDAVILGSAVNNDGSLKAGYTAPAVGGQADVIAEALAVADVDAATIGYVETHGTATPLGDPIEIAALTRAFRQHTQDTGICALGSVKNSVGHLDAAAGVTALIKAVLALKNEAIPPMLHYSRPNPALALEASPFFVNTELLDWPRRQDPRRAGVSSFGIGGTNVHIVLQEAPSAPVGGPSRSAYIIALSAQNGLGLSAHAQRLADHLEDHPGIDLGDVAFTLATRRRAFDHRRTVICRDVAGAVAALRQPAPATAAVAMGQGTPVAFLFPGQGAQHVNMARRLYAAEPAFADDIDMCADLFARYLGQDLRSVLFPAPDTADAAALAITQTAITQPIMFMVEYALARLWRSWGVIPQAMVGHSIGEYVAACLAGVFTLPDAVRLVATRGRLTQEMPVGAMLAVFLPESEAGAWLFGNLCLAAVNSTSLCTVSGTADAIDDLQLRLTAAAIGCRRLHTSHAFHSPSMDGAVEPFLDEVRTVHLQPPQIPFLSNVTGTWITEEQATSPEYWAEHLRRPVRFAECLDVLLRQKDLLLLEVGPGQTLTTFVRAHLAYTATTHTLTSLPRLDEDADDHEHVLGSLAALWTSEVPVDWAAFYGAENRRLARLPAYVFQRQRYWVEPDTTVTTAAVNTVIDAAASIDDWFYTPGWKRLPAPGRVLDTGSVWVLLGDDLPLGRALADRLRATGECVVAVRAGGDGQDSAAVSIDMTSRQDYAAVLASLDLQDTTMIRIVHLWSLPGDTIAGSPQQQLDAARRSGIESVLALAQGISDAQPSLPIAIDVLCRGVYSVTGDEQLRPENATLLGVCTVIPQEIADVICRSLDITDITDTETGDDVESAILAMLRHPTDERELALRGRYWWIRNFDAVDLDGSVDRTGLRDHGVYLITGGLGGLGLAFAEHIAGSAAQPTLGLLGRSAFPAPQAWAQWLQTHDRDDATSVRILRLQHLQELGARVVLLRADITDPAQAAEVIGEFRREFGALNGVVHAAGSPSVGLIQGKSTQDVEQVMAAKTRGTIVLDQVCGDDSYDFMILCSSLTSVLGGPGQSDYCGANAFLDVFAESKRRHTGTPVTAIAWDTWRGVGMAAGLGTGFNAPGDTPAESTGHPLLHRLARATEQARTYVTTFSTADSWIVNEHRIMGHGLVPGTAFLEIVRAAVDTQADGRVIDLHDVLFTMPVIVPDGQTREVYTTIDTSDGRLRFTIQSPIEVAGAATIWQEHASGSVSLHDRDGETIRDLAAVRRDCAVTETLDTEDALKHRLKLDLVEQDGRIRFDFGARWRSLRTIESGNHRLLVTLRLDDEFIDDLAGFPLHPALLDLAGAAARIHATDVYYLPFTYGSVQIFRALTGTVYCDVTFNESVDDSGETLTCDIDILDPDGHLLVRIVAFTIKRINDIDALVAQIAHAATATSGPDDETTAISTLAVLSEGISAQEGVAAFARILRAPVIPAQIVVSRRQLGDMRRLARSITSSMLTREAESLTPLPGTHPRPELDTVFVAARTDEETAIAVIWQEVLGIDQVGVDDNFFALGGHSLAAVQIGAKIRARFHVQLDLKHFFDGPTVANTAEVLAAAAGTDAPADDRIEVLDREPRHGTANVLDQLSDQDVDAQLRELLADDMNEQRRTL